MDESFFRKTFLTFLLLYLSFSFGEKISILDQRKPIPPYLVPVPTPSPPPTPATNATNNRTCFDYELENECSTLSSLVKVDPASQEAIWGFIELEVSNIRMIPFDCRRSLLWYACGTAFAPCSETEEERFCRQTEGCLRVAEACESYLSFECPELNSTDLGIGEMENCSQMIEEELQLATSEPIEVQTCLSETKETITCCPDPYAVDEGGECVISCLQYVFGERFEKGFRITLFCLIWIGLFLVFVTIFPLWMMSGTNLRYPKFVLPFGLILFIFFEIIESFSIFWGGPVEYICDGEVNLFKAINEFGRSTRAGIQISVSVLFLNWAFWMWALFSFNTFCSIARTKFKKLAKFVEQPVPHHISYPLIGLCTLIPFAFFLYFISFFFSHNSASDTLQLAPSTISFSAIPIDAPLLPSYRAFFLTAGGVVLLFFFMAIGLIFTMTYRILLVQWRALFVPLYVLLMYGWGIWIYFYASPNYDYLLDYAICVADNAAQDPAPCERKYLSGTAQGIALLVFYLAMPLMTIVTSNPQISEWWFELLFHQRVLKQFSRGEKSRSDKSAGEPVWDKENL